MALNDPHEPTIIEHTTVNPVVERTTIVERDSWYGEPWAIALVLGAIVIVGLICYWAYNMNASQPAVVESSTTRIIHDEGGRAQTMAPAPNVTVNPPANNPTINVNPPAASSGNSNASTPPVTINNNNSNPPANTTNPSNGNSTGGNGNGTDNGPKDGDSDNDSPSTGNGSGQ
jgi:hypothetical protein